MWNFPLLPEAASTIAGEIDQIYWALVFISIFFSLLILVALVYSAVRYRKGSTASRAGAVDDHLPLELLWTLVPLVISMGIFAWSGKVFYDMRLTPRNAMEVYVVGKQWMWKIQHPQGNREINELHIPIGRPVKLIMTSQDVIHSFYVPAFRIKQDVLPGRYTTQWFEANKVGEYHLFCAEYCGTSHASMIGKIVVMEPSDYERWLAGATDNMNMSTTGEQLFQQFGCQTCHKAESGQRGPTLTGLYGKDVRLDNGKTVIADREYIRESILKPGEKVVAGYPNLMPTFKNQINQEQLFQLVEYIRSMGTGIDQAQRN